MSIEFNNFLSKAKKLHNNFYSYDKSVYINARTKIIITCPIHGDFEQLPYNHLLGKGCQKCGLEKLGKIFTKKPEDFITQASKIHNNKYDYSKTKYNDTMSKVEIICPYHGSFFQTPNKHLQGKGCPGCRFDKTKSVKLKKYSQLFPTRSNKVHNNKYDYSNTNYKNSDVPVKITCPFHGEFMQQPNNHLMGKGCPKCNQSQGEKRIEIYLIENNIKYETQKRFDDCIHKIKLSFDFYIPEKNILIEFDGIQHFNSVEYFGGLPQLEYRQKCDKIKDEYCKNNNISLLRISYKDIKNIDEILSKYLN